MPAAATLTGVRISKVLLTVWLDQANWLNVFRGNVGRNFRRLSGVSCLYLLLLELAIYTVTNLLIARQVNPGGIHRTTIRADSSRNKPFLFCFLQSSSALILPVNISAIAIIVDLYLMLGGLRRKLLCLC
jgi:hypothetical protein